MTAPFLLLALCAIAVLLWMSWQVEGGAAAVNEAGRMRMQAYRMVLSVQAAQAAQATASRHTDEQLDDQSGAAGADGRV